TVASQRRGDEDAHDRCGQPDLCAPPDSLQRGRGFLSHPNSQPARPGAPLAGPSVKAHAPGQLPTAGFAGISHQSEREFGGTVLLPESALCEHPPSLHLAYRLQKMCAWTEWDGESKQN